MKEMLPHMWIPFAIGLAIPLLIMFRGTINFLYILAVVIFAIYSIVKSFLDK